MWGYGVIAGIGVVLKHGTNFDSPFGAITDAILFPLILRFAISMAVGRLATTRMVPLETGRFLGEESSRR